MGPQKIKHQGWNQSSKITVENVLFEWKYVENPHKTLRTRPDIPGLLSFTQFYLVGAIAGRIHNVSYVLKKNLENRIDWRTAQLNGSVLLARSCNLCDF